MKSPNCASVDGHLVIKDYASRHNVPSADSREIMKTPNMDLDDEFKKTESEMKDMVIDAKVVKAANMMSERPQTKITLASRASFFG